MEIGIAIIGIVGTILGTVVGWLLNSLSKSGKLKVYISEWNDTFQYNKDGYMTPSSNIEQTGYYHYDLIIDLYNSSADTKIMRSLEVVFMNGKYPTKINVPKDDATKISAQHFTSYYDVEPINIPPKTVLKYKLINGFHREELNFIWETTRIVLRYTDEKCNIKVIPIKSEEYKTYFERHSRAEEANG